MRCNMTDVTKIIQEDTKEDDTMMSVVKPTEHVFVLDSKKVDAFMKQKNSQFKSAMARFDKFKKTKKS